MKRTLTKPGLGIPGARDLASETPPPESSLREGTGARRKVTTEWESVPPTETRHRSSEAAGARTGPSGRPLVTVDDVGDTAVRLARRSRPSNAPKVVASTSAIEKAPIDTRTAFVLSLVDGQNSVDAIVDMSGMQPDEVSSILARLARLGLVKLA